MTTTPAAVRTTLHTLTPAGRQFMALVGAQHFDFFDDGIVAGSGNWGANLTWQAAQAMGKTDRGVAGVMARLGATELGLWNISGQYAQADEGQWWELTELGAAVALAAAGEPAAEVEAPTVAEPVAQPPVVKLSEMGAVEGYARPFIAGNAASLRSTVTNARAELVKLAAVSSTTPEQFARAARWLANADAQRSVWEHAESWLRNWDETRLEKIAAGHLDRDIPTFDVWAHEVAIAAMRWLVLDDKWSGTGNENRRAEFEGKLAASRELVAGIHGR